MNSMKNEEMYPVSHEVKLHEISITFNIVLKFRKNNKIVKQI